MKCVSQSLKVEGSKFIVPGCQLDTISEMRVNLSAAISTSPRSCAPKRGIFVIDLKIFWLSSRTSTTHTSTSLPRVGLFDPSNSSRVKCSIPPPITISTSTNVLPYLGFLIQFHQSLETAVFIHLSVRKLAPLNLRVERENQSLTHVFVCSLYNFLTVCSLRSQGTYRERTFRISG